MRNIAIMLGAMLAACGGSQAGTTTTGHDEVQRSGGEHVAEAGLSTEAAAEVEASLRNVFEVWNASDIEGVQASLGSELLPSYDRGPQGEPIVWSSGDDILAYARRVFGMASETGMSFSSSITSVSCQATASLGVCAAEVEATVTPAQGPAFSFPYRASYAAQKTDAGWVGTHWHSSLGSNQVQWGSEGHHSAGGVEQWREMPAGDGTIELAVLFQDEATGRMAAFMRAPRNWNSGPHIHTAAHHAIVLEGQMTITDADGEETVLRAGHYRRAFANQVHTGVAGRRGVTVLVITDGRFGTVPVDEEGNPVRPAAEGEGEGGESEGGEGG